MKKILAAVLVLITVLCAFVLPVSAEETITDLTKVYNNLNTYLYAPYYQKSEYYDAYQMVMNEVGDLLKSDDITQEEISKYYNEVKSAYANLMQDTYDYSSLELLLKSYESLDSSIFTPESWKKLLSIRDSSRKELDSPSLFARTESMSEKQYAAYINAHIQKFSTDFKNAFNRLEFIPRPETMTKEYLSAFIKLIRFCAREELLINSAGWNALQEALDDAEKSVAAKNPDATQLNEDFDKLLNAYFDVCNAGYDFSETKEALSQYHAKSVKSFSKNSWERYAESAAALEKRMKQPHFFFIPYQADKETCEKYAKSYLSSLQEGLNTAKDALIPIETYNKLENLCKKYENKTSMEGLDLKLNFLKTRVSEGKDVLSNKDSTLKNVESAIANIESAHNDLIMAEGHLLEEQGKVIKQDTKTSRYTIVFYIATILLSAGLALFLSRSFYGKVNWSK